jgi:hypothetical protein
MRISGRITSSMSFPKLENKYRHSACIPCSNGRSRGINVGVAVCTVLLEDIVGVSFGMNAAGFEDEEVTILLPDRPLDANAGSGKPSALPPNTSGFDWCIAVDAVGLMPPGLSTRSGGGGGDAVESVTVGVFGAGVIKEDRRGGVFGRAALFPDGSSSGVLGFVGNLSRPNVGLGEAG